jgi:hypothetical protein
MKVIDFEKALTIKLKREQGRLDATVAALRTMPVNVRAEVLVGMFSLITREWAKMVLEHTSPASTKARRYARKVKGRSAKIVKLQRRRTR